VEGDSLICTTEFSSDEIREDSLVVFETESGYALTAAASIDNSRIFAVVKRFQREL
jgi:tRNA A37 threonylcarbamoyladenosine synthetase subunit TsaC/SUA5/YrdC